MYYVTLDSKQIASFTSEAAAWAFIDKHECGRDIGRMRVYRDE